MSKESGEIWKDVPGYEGLYKVSTFGNIFSVPRNNIYFDRKRKINIERKVGGKLVEKKN